MIKYILRKPLFPALLLALILFSLLFMGIIKKGIDRDSKAIEEMYNNAVVTFEALPGINDVGVLNLRPHFTDNVEKLSECEKIYKSMVCPYTLRSDDPVVGCGWLYGTNDVPWFSKSLGLTLSWANGFEPSYDEIISQGLNINRFTPAVPDWEENDGDIPCIVDNVFMKTYNLKEGDHFNIAPYDMTGADSPKAPVFTLYIIGSYANETEILERNSIIVPDTIFLTAPSVLYNWRLSEGYCGYRQFKIQVMPEYNRNIEDVEKKLKELFAPAKIVIHSDVRVLKKAVRPIEQRLKIQKALEGPLQIALALATALMAMLTAIGIQEDIFLYMLLGESRKKTFLKSLLSLTGIVLGAALISIAIGLLVLGPAMILWMLKYLGAIVFLCIIALIIPVIRFCNKNLVIFYQTKEA